MESQEAKIVSIFTTKVEYIVLAYAAREVV